MKSKPHLPLGVKSSLTIAIKKIGEHILNGLTEMFNMSNVLQEELGFDSIVRAFFYFQCTYAANGIQTHILYVTYFGGHQFRGFNKPLYFLYQ